jgi:large subunit ribosomal protein L21
MYAVIRSGGKQYRVEAGKTVRVERLEGKVGGKVTFDVIAVRTDEKEDSKKLASGSEAAKAKVTGKIVGHVRGPKQKVLKFKTGGQYKIQRGHRQGYTSVEVSDISLS